MDIRYAPDLLDEVVTRELARREAAGDDTWVREYHLLSDPSYQLESESARDAAFAKVTSVFFRRLGFAAPLERVVREFPSVEKALSVLVVERVGSAAEEEADLLGDPEARAARAARIRVRADRFENRTALEGFLRHELRHVEDLLRPDFGYVRLDRLSAHPAEENLIRARLRLLWNLTIAGSLERRAAAGAASRAAWTGVAAQTYPAWAPETRHRVVEALWAAQDLTYARLVQLAGDPRALLAFAGVAESEGAAGVRTPGTPCPLCGFPTFEWAPDVMTLRPEVRAAVAEDFPSWVPGDGACGRCIEGYAERVRFSPKPPHRATA